MIPLLQSFDVNKAKEHYNGNLIAYRSWPTEKGYPYVHPGQNEMPRHTTEMLIHPLGNRLRFATPANSKTDG